MTPNAAAPNPGRPGPRRAALQSLKMLGGMLPILLGVLLLTSLLGRFIPRFTESGLFGVHPVLDALLGALAGSIAAGQPVISYVLGGELLDAGIALAGVGALVVAWVTVGVSHLPLEASVFGWRFALLRNLLAFAGAVGIALLLAGVPHGVG